MNKLMRKLSISILAVVFAVVAMGATTFAWFTITNTARINQFDVYVTAGSGFEIAVTGIDGTPSAWKSTITETEVEAAIGNVVLKDLTSTDGVNFYPISKIGADVVTTPLAPILSLLKHPLTDNGLAQFIADSKKMM